MCPCQCFMQCCNLQGNASECCCMWGSVAIETQHCNVWGNFCNLKNIVAGCMVLLQFKTKCCNKWGSVAIWNNVVTCEAVLKFETQCCNMWVRVLIWNTMLQIMKECSDIATGHCRIARGCCKLCKLWGNVAMYEGELQLVCEGVSQLVRKSWNLRGSVF